MNTYLPRTAVLRGSHLISKSYTRYAIRSRPAPRAAPQHIHTSVCQARHLDSRIANEQAASGATMDIQDQIMNKVENQEGKRGGGARKSRGGRSGGRSSDVSRALSRLLRHQAENAGIALDGEGYAPLDQVLQWGPLKSLGVTLADVQDVVATNEKQRFSLKPKPSSPSPSSSSPSEYLIRANQGHSIKLESSSLLEPLTLAAGNVPARVVHGTYYAFWEPIIEAGGLSVMGRNHIHCAAGTPDEGVVSGMRRDAQLLIEIDVARSMEAGISWWRSDNGVILTEGDADGLLAVDFFRRVQGRDARVGVLWENGVAVAQLPPDVKRTVPTGKGPRGGGGGGRGRGGRGRGGGGRAESGRGGQEQ
ncbi:RNA 2'-phosphotransferase [Cordyceps militaris CM01]|uniref:2'-phosphotransferase n=1 Tax=Cordyceps militaris (strain CM01) TaxID=983644 RepID=G3JAS2_CORMM|nr:RNA 2'-phosphotransferase [Cordyceps militaris CM01]EGX94335.1 RNA 2'-phosphotransferase [Cordyceps militaris CM01]